jgi:hypothetical protein
VRQLSEHDLGGNLQRRGIFVLTGGIDIELRGTAAPSGREPSITWLQLDREEQLSREDF